MKKVFGTTFVFALIILFSVNLQAQNPIKIGVVDFNKLMADMPGVDSVKIKLQKYQGTLSNQMDAMRSEFENKYTEYQQGSAGMSDLIKATKEKELSDLRDRIDAFQQQAQVDLQAKQQELLQPIIDKAKAAVKEVARENKYTLVLNNMEDVVLYSEPADDITALVKKKLGLQ